MRRGSYSADFRHPFAVIFFHGSASLDRMSSLLPILVSAGGFWRCRDLVQLLAIRVGMCLSLFCILLSSTEPTQVFPGCQEILG
jgi:hypothetical protein